MSVKPEKPTEQKKAHEADSEFAKPNESPENEAVHEATSEFSQKKQSDATIDPPRDSLLSNGSFC